MLITLLHHSLDFLSGAPFCGETRYVCKRYYQLWYLFVHTRYFQSNWEGFPEEPARENPVGVFDIISLEMKSTSHNLSLF